MKRFPKYLSISLLTFFFGLIAVSLWLFSSSKPSPSSNSETNIVMENPLSEVETEPAEPKDEFRTPLDSIWLKDEVVDYEGFKVTKNCDGSDSDSACKIEIFKNNKTLAAFESSQDYWLQYGFLSFLGEDDKQLIVHTYSGGAHCCYDYVIYDLKPTFRVIYDSAKFDSANDVGNNLIPVDINGDGVFEFEQDVMAFDYMSPGGHATSSFPPAIFAYNQRNRRYEPANKKFPNYVLSKLKQNVDGLGEWAEESRKRGAHISQEELNEIIARETFLYLIYAGQRNNAWKYFDKNYKFQFREEFRKDFRKSFSKDPTYKSIYK